MNLRVYSLVLFLIISFNVQSQALFSKTHLSKAQASSSYFDSVFRKIYLPQIHYSMYEQRCITLELEYSSSMIKNPHYWRSDKVIVDSIQLVISQYPLALSDWKINYYEWIAQRLTSLYAIAPELNSPNIAYSIVHQTKCASESEAKKLFHGFRIYYKVQRKHRGYRRGIQDNATILDVELDTTTIDESFFPISASCYISGEVNDLIEYQGKIWLAWSEGVSISEDTGQSFYNRNEGLTSKSSITSFVVHRDKLFCYNLEHVWKWTGFGWFKIYTASNSDIAINGLYSHDEWLIMITQGRDFLLSKDEKHWINRRYRKLNDGKNELVNLAPGRIYALGDSLFFTSGSKVYMTTDFFLNFKVLPVTTNTDDSYYFSSYFMADRFLLVGFKNKWVDHLERSMVVMSLYYSGDKGTSWQKIQYPNHRIIHHGLFIDSANQIDWLTGGGVQEVSISKSQYLRSHHGKWYRFVGFSGNHFLHYRSYYIISANGGKVFRIKEADVIGQIKQ